MKRFLADSKGYGRPGGYKGFCDGCGSTLEWMERALDLDHAAAIVAAAREACEEFGLRWFEKGMEKGVREELGEVPSLLAVAKRVDRAFALGPPTVFMAAAHEFNHAFRKWFFSWASVPPSASDGQRDRGG